MANLNQVTLIGTLTKDPEAKYTPKGTCVVDFSIAINRTWKTEGGEKRDEVTFVEINAFGRVAEIISEWTKKGHQIAIVGRLKQDTWDDKQTGQKRSKMKVVVETMQLLNQRSKKDDDDGDDGEQEHEKRPSKPAARRPAPPPDPDLDAAPDDIPF